jgi:hypothetical protein
MKIYAVIATLAEDGFGRVTGKSRSSPDQVPMGLGQVWASLFRSSRVSGRSQQVLGESWSCPGRVLGKYLTGLGQVSVGSYAGVNRACRF